jgi:HAE1 family hydrophobic/amphiphilic exporter-1
VDLNEATNEVREALDRIRNSFPEEASVPRIRKFDPDAQAIVVLGARSDRNLVDLTRMLDREIRRRFEQISGVGAIDVWGEINNEVRVDVHRDRLLAAGLTINDISQALGRENNTLPGGNVQKGLADVYVRSLGEYTDIEQIRQTVIRVVDGFPLRVQDVADVEYARRDIGRYIEVNDKPMLRLGLRKQSGANTIAVADAIKREVENINQSRNDIELLIIEDQSAFIQQSLDSVRNSAIWGGILAVVILFAFLRNGSTTAIIAVSIPIAIIATFSLLYFGGLTLNQMSFGGLALGVGLIVDNAIVVIENIVRLRHDGKSQTESASRGTKEVGGAIIASTITTSVIFLPIVFMQTVTGAMFKEFALVVVFALMCSLLVALTLVPMLASRFLTIVPQVEKRHGLLYAVETRYLSVLDWALQSRAIVFGTITAMIFVALFGMRFLPTELAPQSEAEIIDIDMNMDEGTNIAIIHEYVTELDQVIQPLIPQDDILHYTRESQNGNGEVELALVKQSDRSIDADELADQIRERIQTAIPGADIRVRTRSGMNQMRRMFRSGGEDSLRIELRGYDLETAEQVARDVSDRMKQIPVVADVRADQAERQPEHTVIFDRERMGNLGISINDVGRAIQSSVGGSQAGVFREDGDEIDITVRLRQEDRLNIQDLDNISVRAADGSVIPVSSLVEVRDSRAPNGIQRIDSQRVTYINANLQSGVALGDAINMIRSELSQMTLPDGFSIVYGGEYEEQQKAQRDFILAIVMAIALIYMVMAAQFERFLDPLIVMFSVPLAIIGVVPALLITNTSLNMQSFMGIVMLVGIVVNNAIVLVDYINLMRREDGLPVDEAVRRAAKLRLRPILMTSLTTILGLLPLAIGVGPGSEMQSSLARVVIGGLTASSLITLIFIPVVYITAHDLKDRLAKRMGKPVLPIEKPA